MLAVAYWVPNSLSSSKIISTATGSGGMGVSILVLINTHMKLIIIMMLALLCVTVTAETRRLHKPVTCDATDTVFAVLRDEFKETPEWWAPSPESGTQVVLTVNRTTGAWSLIEFTADTACVLVVGERSSSPWGTLL